MVRRVISGVLLTGLVVLSACSKAPPPPTPPDPVKLALENASDTPAERAFYAAAEWKPAWDADGVTQLRTAVANRRAHALDRMEFDVGDMPAETSPEEADHARTHAALAYAAALARGATDPTRLYAIYTLPRPAPDLAAGLETALRDKRVGAWLESLAPQNDAYRALATDYLAQGASAKPTGDVIAPLAEGLSAGMHDDRVPAIARQIAAFGYLTTPPPPDDTFTREMADATRRLQADYGIKEDGVMRNAALAVLNYRRSDRQEALAVAMERLRWLERDPPATRIDVNIATARMTYWKDGAIADQRNVVVGTPETKTPQMGAPLFRLISKPTWTIPPSIIKHDNMNARSAASLARSGFKRVGKRIVQAPGPRNSLGLVKFDLRDPYAIYLHDTPAKAWFSATDRHRSHGCVRVKDALQFAELLAGDAGLADKWVKAQAYASTAPLPLAAEIPVRLFYATVLLGDAGKPVVRSDPYGWNDIVARKLGFAVKAAPALETRPVDVGP